MKLPLYQIDAFASRPFAGNPAAVVPLPRWLPAELMQAIAQENNLAETAFFVVDESPLRIRWFTPEAEVKLCGHATLASAYVLFNFLGWEGNNVKFDSASGPLSVDREDQRLTLDFPSQPATPVAAPEALVRGLGLEPDTCLVNEDYVAIVSSQPRLAGINPDFAALAQLDRRGVIVSAPGDEVDFVARFFAPKLGVPEDPVTGSAYTQLAPYWAQRLGTTEFQARQISRRGGDVDLQLQGERVLISGSATCYLVGSIDVPV